MSYNKVIIIGNLGRDPELRYTPQGTPVCTFSCATTDKRKGKDGNMEEKTVWFKVVAWGKQGENASKYLSKGRPVYVEGRLQVDEWTDRDGKLRTTLEVNATEIQYLGDGGSGGGNRSGGGPKSEYDQRRSGPDETEASQAAAPDAAPFADDDVPF